MPMPGTRRILPFLVLYSFQRLLPVFLLVELSGCGFPGMIGLEGVLPLRVMDGWIDGLDET